MEPILTLDLAESPARLRVVSYEADSVIRVWSESTLEALPLPQNGSSSKETEADLTSEVQADNSSQESISEADQPAADPSNAASFDPSALFVEQLTAAIGKLEPVWTSSAILMAPQSYHSINLELPFRDDKSVSKVLQIEAQDRLPFEVDEFVLEHRVLGQTPDKQFDVHVALTRKEEIARLLANCQQAGLDPMAISTVTSLLEGKIQSYPQRFAENAAFLAFHGSHAYLAMRIGAELKCDRVMPIAELDSANLVSEVKRSIAAVEQRYGVRLQEFWLDGPSRSELGRDLDTAPTPEDFERLQKILAKELKQPVKLMSELEPGSTLLVDWFARLCADGKPARLFVNFRSGQFSQTLRWGALWKILRSALPYFGLFALVTIAILIATYISREREISALQDGVIAKVKPLLGEQTLQPGQVVKTIQIANETIEKQLKELGSPSKFSPLDVLSEVTKDFSSVRDANITSVSIRGTQLMVVGASSNYENVDALEKNLQSKKSLYCRLSKQVSGTTTRQFTFTITLCD